MGHRASVPFGALMYEPANDIYVLPNDVIYLFNMPQTFVAFGASGTQGLFKFDAWRLSLAEAIGKQGGLNDSQADPAAVYLYRGETRAIAERSALTSHRFRATSFPSYFTLTFGIPRAISWLSHSPCGTRTLFTRLTQLRWKPPSSWSSCEPSWRP